MGDSIERLIDAAMAFAECSGEPEEQGRLEQQMEDAAAILRAELAERDKAVPDEPTGGMADSGGMAIWNHLARQEDPENGVSVRLWPAGCETLARVAYRAMLTAAPEAQQQDEVVVTWTPDRQSIAAVTRQEQERSRRA